MKEKIITKSKRERNPELSKIKIKNAVSDILREQGYTGLKIRNIAKFSGLQPTLVLHYYRTIDDLMREYLAERDYWLTFVKNLEEALVIKDPSGLEEMLYAILIGHYNCFENDDEMRKIITWEVSEYTDLLRQESDTREEFGAVIFRMTDPYFENTDVEIRAEMAIMTAGIYHLILHAKSNGSTFCGIDIKPKKVKPLS